MGVVESGKTRESCKGRGVGWQGKVRFPVIAGFARIQIAGDSLNSCESSYH